MSKLFHIFVSSQVAVCLPISDFIKLKDDEDTYLPWSARMALRLLQQQALCRMLHHDDDALMCPWIDALPRQVLSAVL